MNKSTPLLIVSDNKDDPNEIVHLISLDYGLCHTALDDDTAIKLFDKHEPQVLLLCFDKLEQAELFYLTLFRASKKVHVVPHQVILLCKATEANVAYNICARGVFDDYVVYKPPYDINRLRLSVQQAVERMKLMAQSSGTFSQVARFGKVTDNLHESIRKSIDQGNKAMEDSTEVYDELAASIGSKLDTLRQRLTSDGLKSAANIRDEDLLKEQFTRFKQESIAPELKRVHSQLDHALSDWVTNIQSEYDKYAEPVKAFEDLISSIPRSIMVVDDDEMYLNILQTVLEAEDYQVIKATDGAKALAMMSRTKPDLILMDLNMPGMGGIEAVKKVKYHEPLKDIPIIMLTGNSHKQVVKEAITAGAIDFIVKPADREKLLEKVPLHIEA